MTGESAAYSISASRLGGLSGSSNRLSSSFQEPYYPVAEISQLGSGQLDSEVPLAGTMPRGLGEGRSLLYAGGVERPYIRMRKEPAMEYARERYMGTAPQ